jgi:acyl carrier protein
MSKKDIVAQLLQAYEDVTGRHADRLVRLADSLSSLELMQFLMAYEQLSGLQVDFADLRAEDLSSIDTFAAYLERLGR